MDPEIRPTIVCAWCGALLARRGPAVSHGVCFACLRAFEACRPAALKMER